MRSILATILTISFVAVAIFGFVAINPNGGRSFNGCIAAASHGGSCPGEESPLNIFDFHINAFKSFSTAVFDLLILGFVVFVAAPFVLKALQEIYRASLKQVLIDNRYKLRHKECLNSTSLIRKLFRWLAIHELRDPETSF